MSNHFLNKYEQITYSKIKAVTDNVGAHVFSKVRLIDALQVNRSEISNSDFRFVLQSHVDFLVTDSKYFPLFSAEYDGPTHITPEQSRRDVVKNHLLKQFGHSFIRINSRYLDKKYRGWDLLTYFIDIWFLSEAFDEAQQLGYIPYDEPFDPASIISDGIPGGHLWPYRLSIEHQKRIEKLWKEGKVAQMIPCHWIGEDKQGNLRGISWIFFDKCRGIYIETGMREQNFHVVSYSDLLSELTTFELYEKLDEIIRGKRKPMSSERIDAQIKKYENSFSCRFSARCNINIQKISDNPSLCPAKKAYEYHIDCC